MKTRKLFKRRYWHKQDWRHIKLKRHDNHLCIRWFHYAKRPHVYWCYWEATIGEQRYQSVKWGKL